MINNSDARELLNAIETYGNRERNYGAELEKNVNGGSAYGRLEERKGHVVGELNEVKRIIRDLIDDPDGVDERFDVPERGNEAPDEPLVDKYRWWFEE